MVIFVKTLTGQTLTLDPEQTVTVADVKSRISELEGIPEGDQRLSLEGK